ncbi:hypothetical protein SAMN06265367_103279 [Algoriphagus winogradskyi]|uniref:Uncharacterized protein n=1 Tax=Algoriphagus winogradskyi TaxID=237017 RepID=A0ABY1NXQ5_9BACT|nr:hypothetical protein SAMN06265367_103279 [Algoriphagus winogradskyi]
MNHNSKINYQFHDPTEGIVKLLKTFIQTQ